MRRRIEQGLPNQAIAMAEDLTKVQLILCNEIKTEIQEAKNIITAFNITDLFPSDWHPKPIMSTDDEKQYKVMTELMTHMFQQCGYLQENIIELDNYQDFLKALQHHVLWEMYPLLS